MIHPDEKFITLALSLAHKSLTQGEVPVGAVVVNSNGEVIGEGRNVVEQNNCQLFHAEVLAISQATKKMGTWRLQGCWIYTTLEPCKMCMGLILNSRLEGVFFGTPSPCFGEVSNGISWMTNGQNSRTKIICSLQGENCAGIMRQFFRDARNREGHKKVASDKAFLEKAHAKLLKMREELFDIATPTNIEDGSSPDSKIKDSADEASSMTMQMLQDAISNTSLTGLKAIDAAIAKIKNGTYGKCEDCLAQISEKRLEFFPSAIRCINCQQKLES